MADLSTLPAEIILLIASYLDVHSFLCLTSTSHTLSDPEIALDHSYWRQTVRSTFRVPNQPVAERDGGRWKSLYKRLRTQTRPYTWGSNQRGNLGHSFRSPQELNSFPPAERMQHARAARQTSWPKEIEGYREHGVIADMQAGGWSTSYLTSKGAIYTAGVVDGMRAFGRPPRPQAIARQPVALKYPVGYVSPVERSDSETAIKQFSSGRAHILGLSDSGTIWSWDNAHEPGISVKLMGIDLHQGGTSSGRSLIKKVVAGWNKSVALVEGRGICVWEPVSLEDTESTHTDTALVLQSVVIPQTDYQVNGRHMPGVADNRYIGEVKTLAVLEECVIFSTHLGRAFVSWITWTNEDQSADLIQEIIPPDHDGNKPFVTDVQGSFRSFAIFTQDAQVLNGTQDQIDERRQARRGTILETFPFTSIPALQDTGVISISFGDHHFLALHSAGHITSYGTESQSCGSLGLGGRRDPEGRLRGIRYGALGGDGKLVPHAYTSGRRVWFEPEKRDWIMFLVSGGSDLQECAERLRMCQNVNVQGEISEWIEQEGNAWGERFGEPVDQEHQSAGKARRSNRGHADDNLAPYFALSVTAAGWHSGALVLVNDTAAGRIRDNALYHYPLYPKAEQSATEAPTPTQSDTSQGNIITTTFTSVVNWAGWLLGLTTPAQAPDGTYAQQPTDESPATTEQTRPPAPLAPAPAPAPPQEEEEEIFANPRIRFPPHRPRPGFRPMRPQPANPPVPAPTDPAAAPPAPQPGPTPVVYPALPERRAPPQPQHAHDNPIDHGAAPNENSHWAWAYDHFPRLELSDGTVMPGTVEIDRWRNGRPEWDLNFTFYS